MLRLASRLQTLRYAAASKQPVPESVARESLQVFAPLANRLGIWQVKWEIEDLSFRFLEPETYKLIARLLDEKRVEREGYVEQLRARLERELAAEGVKATVQGRPKNIYSIVKKMRGKSLDFAQVFDILALRVVVARRQGLLCGAGLGAFAFPADRRGVRRLHRAAEAQWLSVAPHGGSRGGHRAGRQADRDPDPDRGNA